MLAPAIAVLIAISQGIPASVAPASVCTPAHIAAGLCRESAQSKGESVELIASRDHSASSGSTAAPGIRPPAPTMPLEPTNQMPCDAPAERCERPDLPAEPVDAGFPEVTLADLVSFRPATPTLGGEPAGFGVVGMPANFVSGASEQQLAGVLLGYPVTVRFTPTAYVFSYGDGSTLRAASGGTSWEASGVAQFTPTSTSHVYAERGTYATGVTIEYAAAVDFGTGWRPVDGVVTARSADYPVQVVEVRTALVDRTCIENPRGPGC